MLEIEIRRWISMSTSCCGYRFPWLDIGGYLMFSKDINVNEYQDPIKFRKLQDRRLKPGHFKKMLLKKMTNHIHESSGSYGKTQTFQYVAQKRDRSRSGIFRIVEPRTSITRRCSETRPITFVKFETRMVNQGHFNMFANPISICNFEIIRFYSTILKLLDYGTE